MTERRYSREEADAILGRAIERERTDGDLSREQLVAIAQELGVLPESIDRAIGEITLERQGREELVQLRREAWRGFVSHLIPYVGVNSLLIILNLVTTSFPWCLFPIIGWGIGLFSHLAAVAFPNPERENRRLLRKQERERRRLLKHQVKASTKEFEAAVGQGVAALLQAAANRVNAGAESLRNAEPRTPTARRNDVGRVRVDEVRVDEKQRNADGDGSSDGDETSRRRGQR